MKLSKRLALGILYFILGTSLLLLVVSLVLGPGYIPYYSEMAQALGLAGVSIGLVTLLWITYREVRDTWETRQT